jgi:hypothetical protein
LAAKPFLDYPVGTKSQPQEYTLDLSHAQLIELNKALKAMADHPVRTAPRDLMIWPR